MSQQPKWKLIANLGDANPIDYGGYFIYRDETGVYPEEAEYLEVVEEKDGEASRWMVYRFCLDKCTYINGVLSDNKFHPDHPAWWANTEEERKERPQDTTYLKNIADQCDMTVEELTARFCSDDPLERAWAYREVAEYHGWENLDSYPLTFDNREEVEQRYMKKNREADERSEYKDVPNMDGMFMDDLVEYREKTLHNKRGEVWEQIRSYADHKIHAMRYRLEGNVEYALGHEKVCDNIYNEIKDYLDW